MSAVDIVILILGGIAFGATFIAIRENRIRLYCGETIISLRDRLKKCTTQRGLDQDHIARCEAMIESQQVKICQLKETIQEMKELKQ